MILFDFSQPEATEGWTPINDVVMGGRSHSRIVAGEEGAVFSGVVSLQGGGFASIRSPELNVDLGAYQGIRLRVRTDGKHYGVILRGNAIVRVRYQASFQVPADQWATVSLPFHRFEPKVLGFRLPLAPPLNRHAITSCGFIISDKQDGPFRLEIAQVEAYGSST
jgi:monofunctional biosynthetic peptidoglycan transglycosylase